MSVAPREPGRWRLFSPRRAARVVALTPMRDEEWVIGLTLRATLTFCDAVVLADHRPAGHPADASAADAIVAQIRREFPTRDLDVLRIEHAEWMETDVRRQMLARGRALGGTHFVLADADELPTGNLLEGLRERVLDARRGRFGALPMISPHHGVAEQRCDGIWGRATRIPWCFRDAPRLHYDAGGEHQLHRRVPFNALPARNARHEPAEGGLFHLQFADRARLAAKAVWYKMIETLRYPGRRSAAELNQIYDWTLRSAGAELRPIPDAWWRPYRERGWLAHFSPAAPAWQLAEARRLYARHGAAAFAGLDLHGVV